MIGDAAIVEKALRSAGIVGIPGGSYQSRALCARNVIATTGTAAKLMDFARRASLVFRAHVCCGRVDSDLVPRTLMLLYADVVGFLDVR